MLVQKSHVTKYGLKSEKNSETLRHEQASLQIFLTSIYKYYSGFNGLEHHKYGVTKIIF
jgi:hypothetical protein